MAHPRCAVCGVTTPVHVLDGGGGAPIDVDVHPSYVSMVIKGKVGLYDCVTLLTRSLQVDMMQM